MLMPVSDGIKCYPTPTALNTYGNNGLIQNLEAKLQMSYACVVMATYQLSLEHSSQSWFMSKLNINGHYEQSTSTEEQNTHLSQ